MQTSQITLHGVHGYVSWWVPKYTMFLDKSGQLYQSLAKWSGTAKAQSHSMSLSVQKLCTEHTCTVRYKVITMPNGNPSECHVSFWILITR